MTADDTEAKEADGAVEAVGAAAADAEADMGLGCGSKPEGAAAGEAHQRREHRHGIPDLVTAVAGEAGGGRSGEHHRVLNRCT